jgi:hypothetical protein
VTSFRSIARRRVFSNKELTEAAEPEKLRGFASVALDVPPPGLTPYCAGNRHHRLLAAGFTFGVGHAASVSISWTR